MEPVKQRYTCLEQHADGARYRYEGLATNFLTELDVDRNGFVLDYPGRVSSRGVGVIWILSVRSERGAIV